MNQSLRRIVLPLAAFAGASCAFSQTPAWSDDDAESLVLICAVAASQDGKLAITGDETRLIRVWDLRRGTLKHTIEVSGSYTYACYAFSPDGKQAVVGHTDGFLHNDLPKVDQRGTLNLWDLESGRKLRDFANNGERVVQVALSGDGKLLASLSTVGAIRKEGWPFPTALMAVRVWDVSTGRLKHTLVDRCSDMVSAVTLSADGKLCAAGGFAHSTNEEIAGWHVKVWDTASGKEVQSIPAKFPGTVYSIALSPDSKYIATGVSRCLVQLWDRATGKLVWSWYDRGPVWSPKCVAFSPDGKSVLACGPQSDFSRRIPKASEPGRMVLIDVATGTERTTFAGTRQWIRAGAFAPDGTQILAAACLGTQLVESANGKLTLLLTNPKK